MADTQKLKKSLTMFDVYAISTGAMFSSGLFLLPGIAAAQTGNSVYLAYLFAGFLILPAMYCMAELSTAMPKSGGTYYFLDRSMGPLMGTIGGLGSWIAVVFKSAFALVGMGVYLGLYVDLPFTVTAVVLTIVFGLVNAFGAKETTFLQRILVSTLVIILAAFVILGLSAINVSKALLPEPAYGAFFSSGLIGFISTIGLVFVSYAGLTKVASVAEEVQNPDRNIPLGMMLSLITATVIYTLGTLILVKVLEPDALFGSLTPIADGARVFLGWAPWDLGVILIIISAIAAFASTGNAGIMSASRYPFAMAKDKLLPERFAHVGNYGTPTTAIVLTTGAMVAVLVLFDVASVAKLASAFQLMLFGLVCIAVIVMRESRIESYKPGYMAPLYPWLPILGVLISFWLIIEMGILPIAFTGMVTLGCIFWYQFYAAKGLRRRGAIFHVHERLGQNRYEGIERELMTIVHERTSAENLSYEAVVARSAMRDLKNGHYDQASLLNQIGELAQDRFNMDPAIVQDAFGSDDLRFQAVTENVVLVYKAVATITEPNLFVFRFGPNTTLALSGVEKCHTAMFLLTPVTPAGLDLRIAGHLAEIVQGDHFEYLWRNARNERAMNEVLMRDDHFLHAPLHDLPHLMRYVGSPVSEIELPYACLIVLIERGNELLIATPEIILEAGDRLAIIGEPENIARLQTGDPEANLEAN